MTRFKALAVYNVLSLFKGLFYILSQLTLRTFFDSNPSSLTSTSNKWKQRILVLKYKVQIWLICGCISPSLAPQSTSNIIQIFFFVKRSQYWTRGRPTINFSDYSLTMTRLTLLTKFIHLFYNRKTDQSNDNHERIEYREFMNYNFLLST